MSFAYIRYGEELNCNIIRKQWLKFFGKADIEPFKNFEKNGFVVTLPYGKKEQDLAFMNHINERTFAQLEKMEISVVAAEKFINIPNSFERTDGRYIMSAFADEVILDIAKKCKIDMNDAEIVIRDGGDDESILVIQMLAKISDHISVYTQREKYLESVFEDIFNETGLCIGSFNNEYGSIMHNADIVVNCERTSDRNKSYKKGIIYIGLLTAEKYLYEMAEKRHDIKIYGNPVFTIDNIKVKSEIVEANLRSICLENNTDFETCDIKEYAHNIGINYFQIPHIIEGVNN